jgi:hypothetical protein
MASAAPFRDPDVKPPEYRVPRGRSGVGAQSALMTLLNDLERIRRAKEAYGDLPPMWRPGAEGRRPSS